MTFGSRTLINLGLLAMVAVLAMLAVYEPGKEKPREEPRLIELNADGINQLRIERVNGPTVVLERQQGAWRMTEPLRAAMHRGKVVRFDLA